MSIAADLFQDLEQAAFRRGVNSAKSKRWGKIQFLEDDRLLGEILSVKQKVIEELELLRTELGLRTNKEVIAAAIARSKDFPAAEGGGAANGGKLYETELDSEIKYVAKSKKPISDFDAQKLHFYLNDERGVSGSCEPIDWKSEPKQDEPCHVCQLTKFERRGKPCTEIRCPNQFVDRGGKSDQREGGC